MIPYLQTDRTHGSYTTRGACPILVLSRHRDESIYITAGVHRIKVTVCELRGDKCRLGITADSEVIIHREEIQNEVDERERKKERDGQR